MPAAPLQIARSGEEASMLEKIGRIRENRRAEGKAEEAGRPERACMRFEGAPPGEAVARRTVPAHGCASLAS